MHNVPLTQLHGAEKSTGLHLLIKVRPPDTEHFAHLFCAQDAVLLGAVMLGLYYGFLLVLPLGAEGKGGYTQFYRTSLG